ncbi:MAG: FG-GAP repeat domain-containing protein, partial [Flavobacteriales bacterium]
MKKILLIVFSIASGLYLNAQSLCFDAANDTRYETLSQSAMLTVFDLNGDGHLDVMSSGGEDPLSVHLGNGDGTFDPYVSGIQSTKKETEFIDIDSDGDLDFYTCDGSDIVAAKNEGNATFSWFDYVDLPSGSNNYSEIALGDVNGDGIADLLTNDLDNDLIWVVEIESDGSFGNNFSFPCIGEPSHIKMGDLNGDGNPDLAVSPATGTTIGIYFSNNDGTFTENVVTVADLVQAGYNSVEIADIDGDDDLDVLVAGYTMSVLENDGAGNFSLLDDVFMGSYCFAFDTGDWDNDNDVDVAWANNNGGGVTINLNTGDGTFEAQTNIFFSSNGNSVEVAHGDFNEDGEMDLVVANGFERNFSFLEGHGNGLFGSLTLMAGYQS